jgi:hypothetical protein
MLGMLLRRNVSASTAIHKPPAEQSHQRRDVIHRQQQRLKIIVAEHRQVVQKRIELIDRFSNLVIGFV